MRPRLYLVHPTIPDLQQAAPLFPPGLYAESVGDIDRLMAEYQVPAPKRPANLSEKEAAAWDILAMFDITARRMTVTYMLLLRQFSIAGQVLCEALKQYNSTSWKLYDLQAEVLIAMRRDGIQVPVRPPYPTLFTNLDSCTVYATPASPANPGGVGIDTQDPSCQPLGAVWIPVIIVVGIGIVAYAGYKALTSVAHNIRDVFVAREITRQATLEAEWQMHRAAVAGAQIEQCIKAGGDPQGCITAVYRGLPTDLQALKAMKGAMGPRDEGMGLFGWLGAVALFVGAGAGGYALYKWRKKTRKRARRQAEATS
jgi:hypothetical protein